jgi:hypothetical protein
MAKTAAVNRRILPFSRVRKLVHLTVLRFRKGHGKHYVREYIGSPDDAHSLGVLFYYLACQTYDGRAAFTTWLVESVYNGLRHHAEGEYRKRRRAGTAIVQGGDNDLAEDTSRFRLRALLADLSPDARLVVLLAVDPPLRLRHRVRRRMALPHHETQCLRTGLRWYVDDVLRWDLARRQAAYREIREAL